MDRRAVYRLLTMIAVAAMTARIASSERVFEPSIYSPSDVSGAERVWPEKRPFPMPSYGSNDRSRWATIRSLVEDGTFVIGRRVTLADGAYRDEGRVFDPGYGSVDKVKDPTTNFYYSSKPPLYSVLLAGEYWLLHRIGFTLETHRWLVMRVIVWTANVVPLSLFLLSFAKLLERHGTTDWGRLFTFAAACFGTFLTTFATTLNNHVPAAVCGYFAVNALLRRDESFTWAAAVECGFFAGLTACFELPAAALLAALGVGWLVRAPHRAVVAFLPVALIPIAVQLTLNYAAVGDVVPVYAKLGQSPEGKGWYEYPGSHWWKPPGESRRGIDWAKEHESRSTYAFHLLVGHHGVFSLTPIWLLSFAAMLVVAAHGGYLWRRECLYQHVMFMTLGVSAVVIVFFAAIVGTANYGGWTSGARWFFWLAPLWLISLLPAADRCAGSRWRRGVCLALLGVSVFSAAYPAWNPWRHPWIYNWMEAVGGIPY